MKRQRLEGMQCDHKFRRFEKSPGVSLWGRMCTPGIRLSGPNTWHWTNTSTEIWLCTETTFIAARCCSGFCTMHKLCITIDGHHINTIQQSKTMHGARSLLWKSFIISPAGQPTALRRPASFRATPVIPKVSYTFSSMQASEEKKKKKTM